MADQPQPAPLKPAPEATRVVAVRFRESVPFNGETQSVAAPDVSIVPARLDPDGRAVPIEKGQLAVGLLLTRRYRNPAANAQQMERVFVPLELVRGIIYGV